MGGTTAATAAMGPLGLMMAAPPVRQLAAPPLSGACCFRLKWSRPGGSKPNSLRHASFNLLTGVEKAAAMEADPRVSGELVDDSEDDDDDWERYSSGGGAAATGGSPIKVVVALGDGDVAEGDVTLTACGDAESARLLTCELSWEPQFDWYGMPRHRSYHVWAHFSTVEAPAGVAASPSGRTAGGADDRETSWEVCWKHLSY